MKKFTTLTRSEQMKTIEYELFDVLIIGGGITGAGIALDSVTRGMKVALIEMQDFAEGTSSRSTKLVHGGLRYLKQLQVKEVAELGRERAVVYEIGPHITKPVWMLLPFYKDGTFGSFTTSLGLKTYDLLAGVKKGERRAMLSKEKILEMEPLLKNEGLQGGGIYVEYRTDDARLTIEALKAANDYGANLYHYMEATKMEKLEDFYQVEAYDHLLKNTVHFRAKKIVNAAGPWIDNVRKRNSDIGGSHLILSKGVHLVFDQSIFPLKQAIYFDVEDGRMIFAIPREGKTYVGTTDTFFEGTPDAIRVEQEDVAYLLNAIHSMFPTLNIDKSKIESSWVGVRPLIHEEGKGPSEISRKDEIWIAENGVITIAGGKLTGYRKMAEKVTDVISKQFLTEENIIFKPCVTKKLPLSGGEISGSKFYSHFLERKTEQGISIGLSKEESISLASLYGTNVNLVYQFIQDAPVMVPPVLYGQLYYAVNYESVSKPVDFFIRRTGKLFFDLPYVEQHKEWIVREMAKIFKWDLVEEEHYRVQLNKAILESSLQSEE